MPYEQSAPAGGYESYACMQEDTYHKVTHSLNSYVWEAKEGASALVAKVSRACVRSPRKAALSPRVCRALFITIP